MKLYIFFDCAHSMLKFPGQGSNPGHSKDPSPYSDVESLTCCAMRELLTNNNIFPFNDLYFSQLAEEYHTSLVWFPTGFLYALYWIHMNTKQRS